MYYSIWAVFILIVLLLAPGDAWCAYRIELQNGNSILTRHYWEEEGQIKFYRYGGVIGLSRDFVQAVRAVDETVPRETGQAGRVEQGREDEQESESADLEMPDGAAEVDMGQEEFGSRVQEYQEELRQALRERDNYMQEYELAQLRRDTTVINDAKEKIASLQRKINQIRRKVLDIYDNQEPQWLKKIMNEQ